MEDIKDRIKELRKYFGLTQEDFSRKLGLARNSIASYETGRREPTNAVIVSICREFDINETWLRTGDGEMTNEIDEDFITLSAKIEKTGDDYIKELTKMLWSFDVEELKVIRKIIKSIKNNPNL